MKKILLLSAAMLMMASAAFAQNNNAAAGQQNEQQKVKLTPEQRAQHSAEVMAGKLLLSDADAAKFIPVYKAYKMAMKEVNVKFRPAKRAEELKGTPLTDKEIDAMIRNNFAKSKAILDLRQEYYEKFLKVLSVKQVKKIYDVEKEQADKAAQRRWAAKQGFGGHQGKHFGGFRGHGPQAGQPQAK